MEEHTQGLKLFYEGIHEVNNLMAKLQALSLSMLSRADQIEAAGENLANGKIRLHAAVDQLQGATHNARSKADSQFNI